MSRKISATREHHQVGCLGFGRGARAQASSPADRSRPGETRPAPDAKPRDPRRGRHCGFLVVLVGLAMIPLPGPGLLLPRRLALLALEFAWAERLLEPTIDRMTAAGEQVKRAPRWQQAVLVGPASSQQRRWSPSPTRGTSHCCLSEKSRKPSVQSGLWAGSGLCCSPAPSPFSWQPSGHDCRSGSACRSAGSGGAGGVSPTCV